MIGSPTATTPTAPLNKESTSSVVESSPEVEAKAQPKDDTKYVRKLEQGLEIPKFAGKAEESVEDWYRSVQRAFKLGRTHPDLWVHLATSAFEGHVASWWRSSRRRLEDGTLDKVIEGLQARFEYEDRIGSVLNKMTSLKMENGYDAYISNFEDLVAADNGNCSFVTLKHFYLKGLPGNDARGVSLQQPKTLDELYRVSRLVSRADHVAKSSNIERESNKPTPATNMNPQRELSASENTIDSGESTQIEGAHVGVDAS